jgi:hypothetical protein
MKNLILLIFIFSLTSYSQDKIQQVEIVKTDTQIEEFSKQIGQQEFRIDFFDLLVMESLHVGYEKMNDTSTAYGLTMLINLGDSDLNDSFALTPYFRLYFLQSEDYGGYGFFAEVFSKLAFGETEAYNDNFANNSIFPAYENENFFDIALGVGLGRKWINRKGYSFEVLLGLGRNLLLDDDHRDRSEGVGRFNLAIGKRF